MGAADGRPFVPDRPLPLRHRSGPRCGDPRTMPDPPAMPGEGLIDIDEDTETVGLF